MAVGDRGDEQVDGRQPVVADAGQLALRVQRALLDVVVDREAGEGGELGRAARRARARRGRSSRPRAGRAGRWRSGRPRARRRSRRRAPRACEPHPGRVVQQQRRHGRAQPARRTSRRPCDRPGGRAGGSGRPARGAARRPRSARSCASFSLAPRITSSPSSTRCRRARPQLVERRPHGRRLGDRVARRLGRDADSVTPVSHLTKGGLTPLISRYACSVASIWRRAWATATRRVARSTAKTVQPSPSSPLSLIRRMSLSCSTRRRWAGLPSSRSVRGGSSEGSATNEVQRERRGISGGRRGSRRAGGSPEVRA